MRRASLPVALVLLIALTGCIHVTVPAPVPSEPAVEVPVAPVEKGPSAGDIAACEGLVDSFNSIAAAPGSREAALAAMNELANEFVRRQGLADSSDIKVALGLAAAAAARAVDETRNTGQLSSSTSVEVQQAFNTANSTCAGIA